MSLRMADLNEFLFNQADMVVVFAFFTQRKALKLQRYFGVVTMAAWVTRGMV